MEKMSKTDIVGAINGLMEQMELKNDAKTRFLATFELNELMEICAIDVKDEDTKNRIFNVDKSLPFAYRVDRTVRNFFKELDNPYLEHVVSVFHALFDLVDDHRKHVEEIANHAGDDKRNIQAIIEKRYRDNRYISPCEGEILD